MTQAKEYIILGSGIAGMAAAEAIRAGDPDAGILMVSAEKELCFNRPMLIREFALDGSGAALFEKQQDWPEQFAVDVQLDTRAVEIDPKGKRVRLNARTKKEAGNGAETGNGTETGDGTEADGTWLTYDKLIYALGAEVTIPPIPGADREHVYVVRTREDMRRIREAMRGARHAAVIGGGMLGLEDAWAMKEQKLDVVIIEQKQRVAFGQIDQSAGNLMKKRIERMGVPVYVNATVEEIGDGDVTFRHPGGTVTIPADLVILSTGVTPASALGAAAGLATAGPWIAVDRHCRTSDPDIYAAGDTAAINGRNDAIWDEARQMGRVAGANAAAARTRTEAAAARTRTEAAAAGIRTDEAGPAVYTPVVAEHVFNGFDTELFTMADSSGAGTDGVYIRHADVEIFDYQRERYIRVSLQDGIIAGVLLINAPELAPELMDACYRGAGEEDARQIIQRWKESHDVDFRPAAPFVRR